MSRTGDCECLVGIIHNNFFPKNIDVLFCSSSNFNAIRTNRGEGNRVAGHITPKTGVGTDGDGILPACFDLFQGNGTRL